jgi:hypothetical protein
VHYRFVNTCTWGSVFIKKSISKPQMSVKSLSHNGYRSHYNYNNNPNIKLSSMSIILLWITVYFEIYLCYEGIPHPHSKNIIVHYAIWLHEVICWCYCPWPPARCFILCCWNTSVCEEETLCVVPCEADHSDVKSQV